MADFRIGDVVRVRPGAKHPEWGFDIGDWHGRVGEKIEAITGLHILLRWDSPTVEEIPDEQLRFMLDVGISWGEALLPASWLLPAAPRDAPGDAAALIAARREEVLAADPFYAGAEEEGDVVDVAERSEPPETLFDAERFLEVLEIPEAAREAVYEALVLGAGRYYQDYYGKYRYGKRPYFTLPLLFTHTYPFGYGVLAVLEEEAIALAARQTVAHFALQAIDPFAADAIPYGVVEILSFLAATEDLEPDLFRSVFVALELAGADGRFDGVQGASAITLSDWLLTHPRIPESEKVWWLWHFSLRLKDYYHLGKDLVPYWLDHPQLPPERQGQLGKAWLYNGGPVGRPPANWRLMQATFAGDTEAVAAITEEMGIEDAINLGEDELMQDMAKAPHVPPIKDPHETAGDDPVAFFNMLMGMRFGISFGAPGYIRRLAAPLMAKLSDDPGRVLWDALSLDDDVDRAHLQRGVAEALAIDEIREQFSEAERRELVDMGIEIGLARARREFYALGAAWFGPEYVQRAAEDEAASVRRWAAQAL